MYLLRDESRWGISNITFSTESWFWAMFFNGVSVEDCSEWGGVELAGIGEGPLWADKEGEVDSLLTLCCSL